ncbi:response regulator [Microbacterium sp.]|uniref:response regulator n=1 Tax=Microbacterium sp. TaxID=51671 RepID=UPI0039E32F8A
MVGEAADGAAAVALVRLRRPDVALMDVAMPGVDGIDATAAIVAESSTRVLAMTSIDAEGQLVRMMHAGASGYLMKDESPERIIEAVHRTAQGDIAMSAHSMAQLVRRVIEGEGGTGRQQAASRIADLTDRERGVAERVASGATNHEIGAALHISPGTVKTHLEQVYSKLGVRGRVQVGVIFERAGLGPAEI